MSDELPTEPTQKRRGLRRLLPSSRTRAVLIGTGVLAFGVAPLTYAATGGNVVLGDRNSSSQETEIIANDSANARGKGGYSTRQSNLSASGGGAIYGCRATAKTSTNDNKNPCLRANNLSTGLAFEFSSSKGLLGGTIRVSGGGDGAKPFTTNATGVATGLNADRVDGKDAAQIVADAKPRWLLVNAQGQIESQSGGFTVKSAYRGQPAGASENVYIDSGTDLSAKGITATIALQNQTDQGGGSLTNGKQAGADNNPEFSGEISATRCAIAGVVACAPTGTNTNTHFVVSPRLSDGSPTAAGSRKRFYIQITP